VIGSKTLMSVALLVVAAIGSERLGLVRPERFLASDPGTLAFAGFFAAIVGTLAWRFWRLNERSAHYFRLSWSGRLWEGESHFLGGARRRVVLGENAGEAWDLRPRLQHVICVSLALLLGLGSIDARALGLLRRFQRGFAAVRSTYCPDAPVQEEVRDLNAPGCALVRRAFALGFVKDLGDCAATKTRGVATAVCTLRQTDEPLLHYAWRLLDGAWTKFREDTSPDHVAALKQDFRDRFSRLGDLQEARREILASTPHASHHIWTNLPDPGDGAFREETCADRYRVLPHRPPVSGDAKQASKVFEHVLAQLLFESSYEPEAGLCREYHVHWGAPDDVCEQLASSPGEFLTKTGAIQSIRAAFERQRLGAELDALAERSPDRRAGAAPLERSQRQLDPSAFISLQCYIEAAGPPRRSSKQFHLEGVAFSVNEVRVPPSPENASLFVDRYASVAATLVSGFHYGALLSEAQTEEGADDPALEASFSGKDYLLSRLYGLASIDIYLGPGWMTRRPDLLDVYPYETHLRNYVRTFRRQYQSQRGRL
jgi:hypothetical protein